MSKEMTAEEYLKHNLQSNTLSASQSKHYGDLRSKEAVKELELIVEGITEGSNLWKSEYDNCRNILLELVRLKNIKDSQGKTDDYVIQKEQAWKYAKEFLENYQHH